jgi:dCTP deaminase
MILSDKNIQDRLVREDEVAEAMGWWKKGEWNKIGNKILIDPFKKGRLGPCSYDLSVGSEYVSLRDPYKIEKLDEGETFVINPDETVLILTEEYVCLPKNVMAMIVPRARRIFEGSSLNATKIDPTWYGKLLVGFTNLAKFPTTLQRGESFCACYFFETSEVATILTEDKVPSLGRTKIGRIEFTHARPQALLSPEQVTMSHLDGIVKSFGTPWDIVRGAIERSKDEIIRFVESDVAPNIVEETTSSVIKTAYQSQQRWMKILISGIIAAFVALIGLLGYWILYTTRLPRP